MLALIPARGGSKSVPKKNIKPLFGFPLIAYSIAAAKLSKQIDRIIVSTDSQEIADIAKFYGAEVPFLRPQEFASDVATDYDVMKHAVEWIKDNEGNPPEFIVHLRPTTPLRDPELIDKAIESINSSPDSTSLRSAHETREPPHKLFWIKEKFFEGFFPFDPRPEYHNLPRQSFPPAYDPNGFVDILKLETINNFGSCHGNKILPFITPVMTEVDRQEDFEYLEFLLEKYGHPLWNYLKRLKF